MKLSKTITDGCVVCLHGDKYIRCSKRRRPVGVFQSARTNIVLTDKGKVTVSVPEGVVICGPVMVKHGSLKGLG